MSRRGLALAALLAVVAATRVAAIQTSAVNWDEFMLLDRAAHTADTGTLRSGGRSGLAVLLLLPLAGGCQDEIAAVRAGRLLWLGIDAAFLLGFGVLLAGLERDPRRRLRTALLGVGLLALVPAFLEWSLQVRTDQLALAGGVWGGVALLASRRRRGLALLSGVLFGAGFLASQKLLYSAALAGLLAAADLALARDLVPRREVARAALCALGFALAFAAFRAVTSAWFEVPAHHASRHVVTTAQVKSALGAFAFYRHTIGFSQYRALLPTLAPHFLLLVALLAATGVALRRRAPQRGVLAVAWAVLLLGGAVGLFHAAAFAYFWMTLGVFPATALALASGAVGDLLLPPGRARARALAAAGLWVLLLVPAALHTLTLLRDTQRVQRESLAFIARNFAPSDAGFHPERGPFCRAGSHRISAYFSQTIYRRFAGPDREENERALLAAFRDAPVKYLLQSFRLNQFPVAIRRFWADHYQPYRASVFVAGERLAGRSGSERAFDLIVPGTYRWLPAAGSGRLRIGGRVLAAGDVMKLDSGEHTAQLLDDVPAGLLVLALNDPPGPAPLPFYKTY